MTSPLSDRLDRRTALKWMATVAAGATLLPRALAQPAPGEPGVVIAGAYEGDGYGTDPDLIKTYAPGELWPLTFDEHQRATAAVLCGLIIPADDQSPSAADLKVHDFIDEWISSPYPGYDRDRSLILEGLAQLDATCRERFQKPFVKLRINQQARLCNDLAKLEELSPEQVAALDEGARAQRRLKFFFRRFRQLTAGGFYTTPEGMKDVGYLGNVALSEYPQPPADLLARLGVE